MQQRLWWNLYMKPQKTLLVLLLALALTACTQPTAAPSATLPLPTRTPAPSDTVTPIPPSATPSPVPPTATISPSATISFTPEPQIFDFGSLPPGQYIVALHHDCNTSAPSLRIIAPDGDVYGEIELQGEIFAALLEPDNENIALVRGLAEDLEILNLQTGETSVVNHPCREPAWSPDGGLLAYSCITLRIAAPENRDWLEFAIIPYPHDALIIPQPERDYVYMRSPAWSPDGKWLAYFVDYRTLVPGNWVEGPFLAESQCWSEPDTCQDHIRDLGFISYDILSWSPDSQTIAISGNYNDQSEIVFVDVNTGTAADKINVSFVPISLAWSPDGEWIAAGDQHSAKIYLIAPNGDKIVHVYEGCGGYSYENIQWITIGER